MFDLTRYPKLLAGLSQVHLVKRHLRRRGHASRAADRQRSAFYERIWREAAASVAATIEPLGDGLFEITRDVARVRVCRNLCRVDDFLTLTIAGNKPLVHRLLAREGLPTPPHAEFTLARTDLAVEFLETVGGPCVVKPARDTGAGHGVTTGVTDRNSFARAAALAASFGEALLIEKQIAGANYRLLYLDGTLLDAVLRKPPMVIGDGRATVRSLVDRANDTRLAKGASNAQVVLTIDLDMRRTLMAQGLSLGSVPAPSAMVTLKSVVNENGGLDNETVTDLVCESIIADGARAAAAVGSRLAGVDVITPDPTVPLAESEGVICEVNTTPGLYYHYHKADGPTAVAVPILERLLGSDQHPGHTLKRIGAHTAAAVLSTQYSVLSTQFSALSRPVLPPVVLLGGDANALSVARSLSRDGIAVHAIGLPNSPVRWSRFCRWIPTEAKADVQESWTRYLLGPESEHLRGAVLLSCCDDGIELIAQHRVALSQKFGLDESNPDAQLCMLNKLATCRAAVAAGVPTPRFWVAESREQILALKNELRYPIIVKPLLSHVFASRIGKGKFVRANDFDELLAGFRSLSEKAGIEVMLVESIPGPDDRLCSYYTYLDENGRPLFDFTKRIIRRSPMNRGPACYHVTDWNPEVKEVALRLFQHVGLRGLANAEFKRDERDGQLKLIECNARFTAANCLVAESGLDLANFVYNRLVGRPFELPSEYPTGLHLWDPVLDFRAFLELRRAKQITLGRWISSLRRPKMLPYFRWSDPLPSIVCSVERLGKTVESGIDRIRRAIEARLVQNSNALTSSDRATVSQS